MAVLSRLEMDVFFENAKSREALRYEKALGKQLPPNLCGLCLYFQVPLTLEQFLQLRNSHGHAILKTHVYEML